MSVGRPGVKLTIVSEDEYHLNKGRVEQARAALDAYEAMNEAAKQAHDRQKELLRKIEEGREAEYAYFTFPTSPA
jgi:cellobiose-specific phosphotransferase system component IIA